MWCPISAPSCQPRWLRKKVSVKSYNLDMLCLFQVSQHQIYCVFFSQHCTRAGVPSTRLLLRQFPLFQFHLSCVRTVLFQSISRLRFSSQELVCTSYRLHGALCTQEVSCVIACNLLLCYLHWIYSEPTCSFSSVSTNCTVKHWLFYLVEN